MTKAEQRALAYAKTHSHLGYDYYQTYDAVKYGYLQAEQDLGWINVKDELPKSDGYYFTCSDDNGHVQCVGVTEFDSATCQWLDDDDDGYINVDYWMEVPKLKK